MIFWWLKCFGEWRTKAFQQGIRTVIVCSLKGKFKELYGLLTDDIFVNVVSLFLSWYFHVWFISHDKIVYRLPKQLQFEKQILFFWSKLMTTFCKYIRRSHTFFYFVSLICYIADIFLTKFLHGCYCCILIFAIIHVFTTYIRFEDTFFQKGNKAR